LLQPQGHLQLLVNILDYGFDVQSAIDLPRFWWEGGRRVVLEDGFPEETYAGLAARGHEVVRRPGHRGFGGAQPRHDGAAIGW
jgi:gamma-glutamyltranspeptidase/glutathione hydrolase